MTHACFCFVAVNKHDIKIKCELLSLLYFYSKCIWFIWPHDTCGIPMIQLVASFRVFLWSTFIHGETRSVTTSMSPSAWTCVCAVCGRLLVNRLTAYFPDEYERYATRLLGLWITCLLYYFATRPVITGWKSTENILGRVKRQFTKQ